MAPTAPLSQLFNLAAADGLGEAAGVWLSTVVIDLPKGTARDRLVDTLAQLALLNADEDMLSAAILDAASREGSIHPDIDIPVPIRRLLEGLAAESQVRALHAEQGQGANPEGLRRLLLAMSQDLRVVPILLTRHLARLRAAVREEAGDADALARLTRDIHAPLANRLGIWQLKWELEDLAFRLLEPEAYRRVARLMDDTRRGRESHIDVVKAALGDALVGHGITAEVAGRSKHLYSIWRKMQKKHLPFEGLYDLRAVRVLVDTTPECYAVLGVVHALWMPVPGEFDDYIARPKANDYRSLHTCVVGPEGKVVEVQIRTREMHSHAELGVAAHWRYKEGGAGDAALERKVAWMRRLLDAENEHGDDALRADLDQELIEERVYALTPKGEVVDLPAGATPLDFAYRVHTDIGHRCRGAKVDGRIVPLDHKLVTGERVEVMVGKTGEPRRDWLLPGNRFLASPRSREKVRAWFRKLDRERNQQAGREILERELKRMGLADADLSVVLTRFHIESIDELQVKVALGEIGPTQVVRALNDARKVSEPEPDTFVPTTAQKPPSQARPGVSVAGVDNLLVNVARCCQPVPGEPVVGYLTRSRGLSMHRANCAALKRMVAREPERMMPVDWGDASPRQAVDIVVSGIDRKGWLRDVSNLIAQEGVMVRAIRGEGATRDGRQRLAIGVEVRDIDQLSQLLGKLAGVPGVQEARRG